MPELGALFVALAALFIILAWQSWTIKVLQAMKASAPSLFGPLFDALINADSAVYNALRKWTDPAVQPFNALLGRLIASVEGLVGGPLAFARAAYAAIYHLARVSIPDAVIYAENVALGAVRQAEGRAQALFQALQQQLAQLAAQFAGVAASLQRLSQQLVGYALDLFHQVEAYAQQLFAAAEQAAAALVGQEVGRALEAEQAVVAEAAAAKAALEASLAHEVARFESELGTVAQGLEQEVDQARKALGAEIVNFEDLVKSKVEAAIVAFPLALLHRISPDATKTLTADVEAIVILSLAELRKQIRDVEALRARYRPVIQAEIEKVKARL